MSKSTSNINKFKEILDKAANNEATLPEIQEVIDWLEARKIGTWYKPWTWDVYYVDKYGNKYSF